MDVAGHIITRRWPDVVRGPDVVHHCHKDFPLMRYLMFLSFHLENNNAWTFHEVNLNVWWQYSVSLNRQTFFLVQLGFSSVAMFHECWYLSICRKKSLLLPCNPKLNSFKYPKMSTRQAISTTTVDHVSALPMLSSILWVIVQDSGLFNPLAAVTYLLIAAHYFEEIAT